MKATHKKVSHREKKQRPAKIVRFIKAIAWLIFLLFLLSILLYLFVFPSFFKSIKTSKNILFVSSNLNGETNSIYLAHISPNADDNKLIVIDANQKVDVGGGYGEYEIKSIFDLLKIDKKDDQYIKSVFSRVLSLPIDKILVTNKPLKDIAQHELSYFFINDTLYKLSKFNIDFVDSLKFHYLANNFAVEKVQTLAEFKEDLYLISTLDRTVYQYCSVAVVNTTTTNGLARDISQLVENTGAMVVKTEGSDESLDKTMIYYATEPADCSRLVNSILGIFPTKPIIKHMDKLPGSDQYRSRVIIKVGKDVNR